MDTPDIVKKSKGGRIPIYAEPTARICLNLPKSVADFLGVYAVARGLSRSAAAAELLETLRLEALADSFAGKPL